MKHKQTQRLFYKKWPYKVLIKVDAGSKNLEKSLSQYNTHIRDIVSYRDTEETYQFKSKMKRWFKRHIPDGGIRCERTISLFCYNTDQVDFICECWRENVLEIFSPASASALKLMDDNIHDIVRKTDWYRKYPVRARIMFNKDFSVNGISVLIDSLKQILDDDWHCQGTLLNAIKPGGSLPFPCGQPYYLYLKSNDDAVMLRLTCGDYIDRFERIRKP
jgi:hypothetical protein